MSLFDKLRQFGVDPKIIWALRPEVLCCPNIPKPMSGLAPRVILGKEWWDQTRHAAYRSTDYHCIACGVHRNDAKEHQWLEGHELYDIDYLLGQMTYLETIPLCHWCHCFIHNGRLQVLLRDKKITVQKYDSVIDHGLEVLLKAGLTRPPPYQGVCARWSDWRLILDDKEYPPLYPTEAAWYKEFVSASDSSSSAD